MRKVIKDRQAYAMAATAYRGMVYVPDRLRADDPTYDNHDAILNGFNHSDQVYLPEGNFYINSTLVLPDGKQLVRPAGSVLKLMPTATLASAQYIVQHGEGSELIGGALDGNWNARVAQYAIDGTGINDAAQQWTWGIFINDSDSLTTGVTTHDCSCTTAEAASNGGFGGNGGAVLMNVERSTATKHVARNRVLDVISNNPNAGFHFRIRSTFTSQVEDTSGYYAYGNEFDGIVGFGGIKNAVELLGPQTRFNRIGRGIFHDHRGFGGAEADFGGYGNEFEDIKFVNSPEFIWARSWDGFSQRVSKDGAFVKLTRDNVFIKCAVLGGTLNDASFIRGFRVVGPETTTSDVVFDTPIMLGQIRGGSATADRFVGIGIDTTSGPVGNVDIITPQIKVPDRALKGVGAFSVDSIKIRGGVLNGALQCYEMVGLAPVGTLRLDDVRFDSVQVAVQLHKESVTTIRGGTFLNTAADKRCIEMPSLDGSVVKIGGNDFSKLATGSQNPFTGTATGDTTGTSGVTVIDEGGNVYGYRTPGSVSRGGHGAAWFGDNDFVGNPGPAIGFTSMGSARVRSDSVPTVGTWALGSIIEKVTPAPRASPGWRCTVAGTYGTLTGVTATTANGSPDATFSDVTSLRIGQWVAVATAGTRQIKSINTTTSVVTMTANYSVTATTQAASWVAPTWEELAYMGAKTYTLVVQPLGGTHTTADLEKTFSNAGATAISVFTLMTAAAGYRISYSVVDSDGIRVVPSSGDTIQDGTGTPSLVGALGKIESTAIGSTLTLESQDATQWFVSAKTGTWTVT